MKSIYEYLPNEIKENGYIKEVICSIYSSLYIKQHIENKIEKVMEEEPIEISTLEGLVLAMPGMYIVTGSKGEKYVIDQTILDLTYDKVPNKQDMYVRKQYPVIAEKKTDYFATPCYSANGGFLKGKPGDYLIQSMIVSKNTYPIDSAIFEETYIPFTKYIREKYNLEDEFFEEEMQTLHNCEKISLFQKIKGFIINMFYR